MSNNNSRGWEDVNQDSFRFFDPSTNTFTSSAPENVPAFLSASSLAYDTDIGNDLLWPEEQEEQELGPEEVDEARQRVAPQATSWAEEVTRVREAAGIEARNPMIERQLSYLRSRPSRGVDWMRKASAWNRKVLSDYQDSRPSVNLTIVDVTQLSFWNARAQLAAWAISRGNLDISVPDTVMARITESNADFEDSLAEQNREGFPILRLDELHEFPEAKSVRTMIVSTDLNQGTLRDIQDGALEVVQLEETRVANATARRLYHQEGWADFSPEFQRLVGSWSESLEALRSAGMPGLAPPL
ncbi:hypothetical protein B9479_005507 [Cryptococcus floricola]|uniref:Uncharacterized protein n=1 Tax=Cryptococcus floricola TaxID=2591691 RepID=A0A5D3AUD1_9TREE|nr:hypothetical protein B9479_005507 [Cryptococcus floricola]